MKPRRARGARWVALDLLRFCAVFLMVQGHTFTTLLEPAVKAERWYRHHNFLHGYTAPMFLFASGLAFGFTTFRAWEANTSLGGDRKGIWKRFRRYASLVLLGYLLHLPSKSLHVLLSLDEEHLRRFLQVDVLQHVGVSLALCQTLAIFLRTPERFIRAIAVLFVLFVFGAPFVFRWPAESLLPYPLAGFVNSANHSLFPLIPWAAFTYAGILCAYAARRAVRPSLELAWPLAMFTASIILIPVGLNHTRFQPYPPHDFWQTSPYFFFWRLGNVMGVLTLLCFLERAIDHSRWAQDPESVAARALSWVRVVGQESLAVYVAHLVVLHGSVFSHGIHHYTRDSLGLLQSTGVAIVLFCAMILFAQLWSALKSRRTR